MHPSQHEAPVFGLRLAEGRTVCNSDSHEGFMLILTQRFRYCNMDFIVHWGIVIFALTFLKTFFISYDIACQWSINFIHRLREMNVTSPFLQPDVDIRYVVPKFHLPAHIARCQTQFAFMFTWGCGLGDGEAPERGWGDSGPLAPATRKMGPGSRRDVLDFNWGDYNWRKTVDVGESVCVTRAKG